LNDLPLVGVLDWRKAIVVERDARPRELVVGSVGINGVEKGDVLLGADFVLADVIGIGNGAKLLVVPDGCGFIAGAAAAASVLCRNRGFARDFKAFDVQSERCRAL